MTANLVQFLDLLGLCALSVVGAWIGLRVYAHAARTEAPVIEEAERLAMGRRR